MDKGSLRRSSCEHHKMEKWDIGEAWPSVPERVISKVLMDEASPKAALFDLEELEEGEIRQDQLLIPGKGTAISSMREGGSRAMSYVDEELEEGEMREGLTPAPGQNAFENLIHEASSEISLSDVEEIGEAGVREGQSSLTRNDDTKDFLHETSADVTSLDDELEEGEIRESPAGHIPPGQPDLVEQDEISITESPSAMIRQQIRSLKDELLKKQIDLIDKIYSRRLRILLLRQNEELQEFKTLKSEQQLELVKMKNLDLNLIHAMDIIPSDRVKRIKSLNEEFSRRMDEFDRHMKGQRRKLAVMQIGARNKEKQRKDHWLEKAKAGMLEESLEELPLSGTGFKLEKFKLSEHYGTHEGLRNDKAVASSSDLTTRPVESIELTNRPTNSVSSRTNVVESCELSRPSPGILPINQNVRTENMPLETKDLASHSDAMNGMCDKFDGGDTDLGIAVTVASKKHGGTGSSFVCSTAPTEQDQTEIPSFAHALKSSEGAKSVSCDQGPSISGQERSAEGDQGSSSLPNNVSSALNSVDTGFQRNDPSISPSTVSNSTLLELPLSVGLASIMHDQGSSPAPVGSVCNQIHCSAQLNEASMQQPVVATTAQLEHSDFTSSQPLSHPVGLASTVHDLASRPASVRSDQVQIHDTTQPTEVSMQQQLVVTESNHTSSQPLPPYIGLTSAVHGHPSTPAPAGSDLESFSQIHCSSQLLEVPMRQPVTFTAAHWEQFSHSLSHPSVHPMLPTTDIPPAGTQSEYLRATGGQPERGSYFPFSCTVTQSMPQQDPHLNIFHYELRRLYGLKALCVRRHAEKKHELKLQCEKEIENLRKRYDALIQETEREHVKRRKEVEMMYSKVSKHQELAERFREIFNETIKEARNDCQGASSSTGHQFIQVLQQNFAQSPVTATPSRGGPPLANLTLSQNQFSLPSVEVRRQYSAVVPVPPVQTMHGTPTVLLSNPARFHSSSMFSSISDLPLRSIQCGLASHLHASGTSTSASNLRPQNGSRWSQQQIFHDMGVSLSASEPILSIGGSHQAGGSRTSHLRHSTSPSPSTYDSPSRSAGSHIGVKRTNPDD